MGLVWEWLGGGSLERSIDFAPVLSSSDSNYGGGYVFEEFEPAIVRTFRAESMPGATLDTLITACSARKATYTLTDSRGVNHTGYVVSLSWTPIRGSTHFQVDLSLRKAPTVP